MIRLPEVLTFSKKDGETIWPTCGFSKNVFFRESLKPCFFVDFNIIISHITHIFPKNLI